MYLDEYEANQRGETYVYPKSNRKLEETLKMRKVICINNKKIFKSLTEASEFYNIRYGSYI